MLQGKRVARTANHTKAAALGSRDKSAWAFILGVCCQVQAGSERSQEEKEQPALKGPRLPPQVREATEGSSTPLLTKHWLGARRGRTSLGTGHGGMTSEFSGRHGRKSRAQSGCLRSGGHEDSLARGCLPQAVRTRRAARMLTPMSSKPTSQLWCTRGSGPTRENSQASKPLPGTQGSQPVGPPQQPFSAGDEQGTPRPPSLQEGQRPWVFLTLVKCGRRAPALSFPLRQKRQKRGWSKSYAGCVSGGS